MKNQITGMIQSQKLKYLEKHDCTLNLEFAL